MEEDMTDNKPRARIKSDAISRMAAFYTMFIPFEGELPDENNDTAIICYTWMIAGIL